MLLQHIYVINIPTELTTIPYNIDTGRCIFPVHSSSRLIYELMFMEHIAVHQSAVAGVGE